MATGLGVLIKSMTSDPEAVAALEHAIGRTLAFVALDKTANENSGALRFAFADGTAVRLFDDGQSCCEIRYMACDDDLDDFAGATVTDIEIRDVDDVEDEYGDRHDVQFLHVQTDQGAIVVSMHNEHNGYYGGFYHTAEMEDE